MLRLVFTCDRSRSRREPYALVKTARQKQKQKQKRKETFPFSSASASDSGASENQPLEILRQYSATMQFSFYTCFFNLLFQFNLQNMLSQERLYFVILLLCSVLVLSNKTTHTQCSMLSPMYKTQTSTRRDLLQMSRFIPAEVELLRWRNLAPVAECVFPVSVFSFLAGSKLFSCNITYE